MSAKDKIIFGVLVVLIGVAGYFQYMATNMIARMDELNKNDVEHVDVVHNKFRKDLRKLNLQFIGRGKHLQKAQQDIITNTKYIEYVTDSLGNAIQEVQYNLDELVARLEYTVTDFKDEVGDIMEQMLENAANKKEILADLIARETKPTVAEEATNGEASVGSTGEGDREISEWEKKLEQLG